MITSKKPITTLELNKRFQESFYLAYGDLQEDSDVLSKNLALSALNMVVVELDLETDVAAKLVLDNPAIHALIYEDARCMNLIENDGSIEGI